MHTVPALEVAAPIEAVAFCNRDELADGAILADASWFDTETVEGHVDVEGGAEGVVTQLGGAAADEAGDEGAAPGEDSIEQTCFFPSSPEGGHLADCIFVEPDPAVVRGS